MQRRRFIKILAANSAVLGLGKFTSAAVRTLQPVRWTGYTLGAEGSFTLYTKDPIAAKAILQKCFAEVRRLESVFSLYEADSEISRLNQFGTLHKPSADWLHILKSAGQTHTLTGGLFDPTIQPIWKAYDKYFQAHPNAQTAPKAMIDRAVEQCGWEHVNYESRAIHLNRPGMQLTLNGVAQGYITDRVTEILKDAGYGNVLVELGETRAIGPHPEGRPWAIGVKHAAAPQKIYEIVEIKDRALATSGSYGSPFSKDGSYHHLVHPKTGRPATQWKSISVIAPTATEADALSTGMSFASAEQIDAINSAHPELKILKQA